MKYESKQSNTKIKRAIKYSLLIFVCLFSSCKKETHDEQSEGKLQITVKGIEDYIEVEEKTKLSSHQPSPPTSTINIINHDSFDAITSIIVTEPLEGSTHKETNITSKKKKIASTTSKMNGATQYRLIFYKTSNNEVVYDETLPASTERAIRLPLGQYKYVAFSTNETSIPEIVNNRISKNLLINKDVLYASSTMNIVDGDNFMNLTFKRQTTKYELTLDVRGMFATINNETQAYLTNDAGDLFQSADFDLTSGQFDQSTLTPIKVTGEQLQPATYIVDSKKDTVTLTPQNDIKRISFYSATTIKLTPANKMKIEFAPLSIKMDDGSNRVLSYAFLSLNNTEITGSSTKGRQYTVNVHLVESPIKTSNADGATQWARSNLWYDANKLTSTGAYRFRVSPHQRDLTKNNDGLITDPNDLWKFNTSTPNGATQTNGFDPCTRVYPDSLWKMPSENDFLLLGSSGSYANSYAVNRNDYFSGIYLDLGLAIVEVLTNYNMELVSKWNKSNNSISNSIYDIPYSSSSSATTMNDLFLSGVGYRNTTGTITNRPIYTKVLRADLLNLLGAGVLQGFNGNGYYWTSKGLTLNGTLTSPTYFTFSNNNSTVLDLNLTGLNVLTLLPSGSFASSTGTMTWNNAMNIRCVRNPNYPRPATY